MTTTKYANEIVRGEQVLRLTWYILNWPLYYKLVRSALDKRLRYGVTGRRIEKLLWIQMYYTVHDLWISFHKFSGPTEQQGLLKSILLRTKLYLFDGQNEFIKNSTIKFTQRTMYSGYSIIRNYPHNNYSNNWRPRFASLNYKNLIAQLSSKSLTQLSACLCKNNKRKKKEVNRDYFRKWPTRVSWGCRKNWDEKTPKGSKEGKSVADPPPPPLRLSTLQALSLIFRRTKHRSINPLIH